MEHHSQKYLSAEVSEALTVPGLVKSYTHFVITVRCEGIPQNLPGDNSNIYPIAPYQVKALRRSRKLCQWRDDVKVERRYSELVDLRSYLVMAYPMLVFPPLPAKTTADNMNTTLQSETHLREQRRVIRRFLTELLSMNDVVLYDANVADALQQDRDVYVREGLVGLRADLSTLSSAQGHIDDHKSVHQRSGSTSTAALVESTSKAFKGLFSYMSGTPSVSPYLETAKAQLNSDSNYTKWLPILQYVRELSLSLSKTSEEFLKLLPQQDEMEVATLNITPALYDYDGVLGMCEWFKPLKSDVVDFAELFKGIGVAHQKEVDQWHTKVVELMRAEAGWMASAEAAVEYLLALYLHVALLLADPYKSGSAEAANYRSFLEKTTSTLSAQMSIVTGQAHNRRMHLLLSNFVKISSMALDNEEKSAVSTQYYARRLGESRQSAEEDWAEQLQNLPWKQ